MSDPQLMICLVDFLLTAPALKMGANKSLTILRAPPNRQNWPLEACACLRVFDSSDTLNMFQNDLVAADLLTGCLQQNKECLSPHTQLAFFPLAEALWGIPLIFGM